VHGANNAVFVQAEAAGNLMFYGAGAGGVQTASAVLGDVVSAARRHIAGGVGVGESTRANLPVVPIGRVTTRYQITLEVSDEPGVLATVAGILSEGASRSRPSRQTVLGRPNGERAPRASSSAPTGPRAGSQRHRRPPRRQRRGRPVVSVLRVEGD
jgi:homoserine dehydrogenase